jgi:hypothetical protein
VTDALADSVTSVVSLTVRVSPLTVTMLKVPLFAELVAPLMVIFIPARKPSVSQSLSVLVMVDEAVKPMLVDVTVTSL